MVLSIEDVEKLKQLYPEHRIELRDGAIIIMSPSDLTSAVIGSRFSRFLGNWVDPRDLGFVADASAGYIAPGGDLSAPDVSFVSRQRLPRSPRTYAQVIPELVVEIKSSRDRVALLVDKLQRYLELGAQIGILIDPDTHTLSVHRLGDDPEVLRNGDVLKLPELLPGWEVAIADLWPPVFEEPPG
jgi:Uma2 family endonuclease